MVKRKSHLYYIPEPMLLKHIFRDLHKAWFICVEARAVNSSSEQCVSSGIREAVVVNCSASDRAVEGILWSRKDGEPEESLGKHVPGADVSTSGSNEAVSFSVFASRMLESEQVCFDNRGGTCGFKTPDPGTKPPLSMSEAKTEGKQRWQLGKDRTESEKVRKKLLAAANNIRMQGKMQKIPSAMSFICRSKSGRRRGGRFTGRTVIASLAKFLVFQIPETE
ncbi:PREDICTED: uncharacterized protein LOC104822728 isoform X2 [Tarenaya hassleriana]|nr:PREDICTED: uncharacterized protein LOC104822728 isoform X2 [Tarenaya hassleriana]